MKHHRRVLYVNLLTSGKLTEHLREIDTTASERRETIIRQMAMAQGITERLKVENQMLWVGMMNNICACVDEIIKNELIYMLTSEGEEPYGSSPSIICEKTS